MTCKLCEEKLLEYLYDELGETDRALMDRHLAESPACRETLEGFRAVRAQASGQDLEELPAGFTTRVLAHAAERREERRRGRRRAWFFRPVLATAAVAVVATILYVHTSQVQKPADLYSTRLNRETRTAMQEAERKESIALLSPKPGEKAEESAPRQDGLPGFPADTSPAPSIRKQAAPEVHPVDMDQTRTRATLKPPEEKAVPEAGQVDMDQTRTRATLKSPEERAVPEAGQIDKYVIHDPVTLGVVAGGGPTADGRFEVGKPGHQAAPQAAEDTRSGEAGTTDIRGALDQTVAPPTGDRRRQEPGSPGIHRTFVQTAPSPVEDRGAQGMKYSEAGALQKDESFDQAEPGDTAERKPSAKESLNGLGALSLAPSSPAGQVGTPAGSTGSGGIGTGADLDETKAAAPPAREVRTAGEDDQSHGASLDARPSESAGGKAGAGAGRETPDAKEWKAPAPAAMVSAGKQKTVLAGPESSVPETGEMPTTDTARRVPPAAEREEAADFTTRLEAPRDRTASLAEPNVSAAVGAVSGLPAGSPGSECSRDAAPARDWTPGSQAPAPVKEEPGKDKKAGAALSPAVPATPPIPASAPSPRGLPAPVPETLASVRELATAGRCLEAFDLLGDFATRYPAESACGPAWLDVARCFRDKGDRELAGKASLRAAGFPASAREAEAFLRELERRND